MSASGEYGRLRATVTGRVQGVGYRYFVQSLATRLELSGWVRNRPDGGVELEAEGTAGALAALVDELKVGPTLSKVTGVHVEAASYQAEFDRFEIRF